VRELVYTRAKSDQAFDFVLIGILANGPRNC
jgi:hypothetical protein